MTVPLTDHQAALLLAFIEANWADFCDLAGDDDANEICVALGGDPE